MKEEIKQVLRDTEESLARRMAERRRRDYALSKREEIREGLWQILRKEGHHIMEADRALDEMMQFLHSQEVVIKVDREMPTPEYMFLDGHSNSHYITQNAFATSVSEKTQQKMLKAGYVATIPLVGENK